MNTEHLREILILSESLSLSKAAEKLYMTQSCLSRHISAVENELGLQLFSRSTTGVSLTPAGEMVVEGIRKADAIFASSVESAFSCINDNRLVRIAACIRNDYAQVILNEALSSLGDRNDLGQTVVTDIGTRDWEEPLVNGVWDIVVAPCYNDNMRGGGSFKS